MNPTNEQDAIFKYVKNGKGNAIIEALAGTGKTTTIVVAANIIPKEAKSIFLAFNKDIVEQLLKKQKEGKFSKKIEIRTLNSFGHGCLLRSKRYHYKSLDNKYLLDLIKEEYREYDDFLQEMDADDLYGWWSENKDMLYEMRDQISICKAYLALTKQEIRKVSHQFAYCKNEQRLNFIEQFMHRVYLSNRLPEKFDFKDQIFLPAINQAPVGQYDYIFIDECQDLNRAQHKLLSKMMHQKTRVFAVGDPQQAIYGFNGADTASFGNLKKMLPNLSVFPLTTCFRCKENIISFVNSSGVNSRIKHHSTNTGGKVRYGSYKEIAEGDLVLCRINAPLYELFGKLQKTGLRVGLRGDKQTITMILNRLSYSGKKSVAVVLANELRQLEDYGKYLKRTNKDYLDIKEHPKYQHRKEYYDIMSAIAKANDCKTGKQLRYFVNKAFNDPTTKVNLMSIHRSKGLEAKRVFIVGDDLTPHSLAKEPWQQVQEDNLIYVSYTRAKSELIFINDFDEFVTHKNKQVAYVSMRYEGTLLPAEINPR